MKKLDRFISWVISPFFRWKYYRKDHSPKYCCYCGSKDISYITKETIANVEAEFSCVCVECDKEIGYWAYGYYNPIYSKYTFNQESE